MPLIAYHKETNWSFGIWKITETANELIDHLPSSPEELQAARQFSSASRRKEWLATRVLLQELCGEHKEIRYKESGEPYLADGSYQISISHTKGYAAVMLGEPSKCRVGIDMEYLSKRVLKVKDHFLSSEERSFIDPQHEANHLLICWCAKEAIYKMLGKEGVEFSRDLQVQPFPFDLIGSLKVRELVTPEAKLYSVRYIVANDYVLTTISSEDTF